MVDVEPIRDSEDRLEHPRCDHLWWFYAALVAIHLLSGLVAQQPRVLADELGYLGNARFIAGVAHLPDMGGTQLYHFGYSLFLLPAFWFFADPVSTYKAALAINALLASSLIFPLTFALTVLGRVSGRTSVWIAFACCLYPPLVFHSSIAWSENAYIPLYAIAMVLFGRFLGSRRGRDAILFGLATGFLYTVHPRGVPVIVGVTAYLVLLVCIRSISVRQLTWCMTAMSAVAVPTRIMLSHLKTLGWGSGGEALLGKLAGRMVPDGDVVAMAERMAGQLLYLIQASNGLVALGLLSAIGFIVRRLSETPLRRTVAEPAVGTLILTLLTSAGVFLASCASKLYSLHGPQGLRAENLIYGRYNEPVGVILIAVAIAWLCRNRSRATALGWRSAAVVAITLILTWVVVVEIDDAIARDAATRPGESVIEGIRPADIQATSIPGIYPQIILVGGLNLIAVSTLAMACFVVIVITIRRSHRIGLALVIAIFSTVAVANHRLYLTPAVARASSRLAFVSQVGSIGPIEAVSYDSATHQRAFYGALQYLMPNTVFTRFDSQDNQVPTNEAVISGNDWYQARELGARFFVSASHCDNALWLMPGELMRGVERWAPEGDILGLEPVIGVRASGLGQPEISAARLGRWTNGAATISVHVDEDRPPLMLGIDIAETGRDTTGIELQTNGVPLSDRPDPWTGGAATFSLARVPMADRLTIEIFSDTRQETHQFRSSPRRRDLGVFVRNLRLDSREALAEAATAGLLLGASQVLGYPESGFYGAERHGDSAARWTNGAASLRIPMHRTHRPGRLEVATVVPGRDWTNLRVRANGVVVWDGSVASGPWSRSFELTGVALGDELLVELLSETFCPAEMIDGSTDRRTLGVKVLSIRLLPRP